MADSRRHRGRHLRGALPLSAAAALALACAGQSTSGGPEAPVRLDAPAAVGWEPDGPFALRLELHNASGYTLALARPRAEALQVQVFRQDGSLACRTPSATHRQYEATEVVPVRAASGLPLEVDVRPSCPALSPGVYRYEAVYVANPAQGGSTAAYVGTLGPQGGQLAVGPGLSRDRAALTAALASRSVNVAPPARQVTEPPAMGPVIGSPATGPASEPPITTGPANPSPDGGTGSAPASDPRACVDRELARRGLNAYGDPQGTRYAAGPPADEGGRPLYVAGRNAEIRRACGMGQ